MDTADIERWKNIFYSVQRTLQHTPDSVNYAALIARAGNYLELAEILERGEIGYDFQGRLKATLNKRGTIRHVDALRKIFQTFAEESL